MVYLAGCSRNYAAKKLIKFIKSIERTIRRERERERESLVQGRKL